MHFDQPNDPQREARDRLEAESWLDVEQHASEMRWRHAPMSFKCLGCGQEPPVPYCVLCRGEAA